MTRSTLRTDIDDAIASGRAGTAQALLGQLWTEDPTPATASFVVSRFDRLRGRVALLPFRVAILRSFTVEPVVPVLRAEAAVNGIELAVHVGDFNAYVPEILAQEGDLYRFDPMLVILAVQTRDAAPELWFDFAHLGAAEITAIEQRLLDQFATLIRTLHARSRAHLLIHGFEVPAFSRNGILDDQSERGQGAVIQSLNAGIARLAREHPGTYVLDYDGLVARHGRLSWHDERKALTMRSPIGAAHLVHLAREWTRFIHPLSGRVAKALAVDLDNTLWGGVIGEDGVDGIVVGPEYPGAAYQELQRTILDLHQRGVILAVCSKNNPADAMEALERHPGMLLRPHHFASIRINWNDKVQNLREIAEELNIGTDALAFLDDDRAERERVRGALPEVGVIALPADPMDYARTLRECPLFERLALSDEDRARPRYYAEERLRADQRRETASLEDFYRSLGMHAELVRVGRPSWPRVAQLTQKTNQFNLTTRRYSEQDIAAMATDPRWRVYALRLRDRFGDNGLVGVGIIRADGVTWDIDTLLLSCRVIGRTVETAFLATMMHEARLEGVRRMRGTFVATKKNAPVKEYYGSHGFACTASQNGISHWELDIVEKHVEPPPWITTAVVVEDDR